MKLEIELTTAQVAMLEFLRARALIPISATRGWRSGLSLMDWLRNSAVSGSAGSGPTGVSRGPSPQTTSYEPRASREPCPDCNGSGEAVDYNDCLTCHGTGVFPEEPDPDNDREGELIEVDEHVLREIRGVLGRRVWFIGLIALYCLAGSAFFGLVSWQQRAVYMLILSEGFAVVSGLYAAWWYMEWRR